MTPSEFYARMCEIRQSEDFAKSKHERMDALMCELLQSLGYSEGIEIFKKSE